MKTIDEIINQEPVFLNDFSNSFDVIMNFENVYMTYDEYIAEEYPYPNVEFWTTKKQEASVALQKYQDVHILFASYGYENYSGDAWVLFEKYGKLYEVNGSHCSCYGLEDQWVPEEVYLPELKNRLENGTFGESRYSGNMFKWELMRFLGIE